MSRTSITKYQTAGFTLIEVLIALAIVSVALASLSALIGTTTRGVLSIEGRLQRVDAAKAIIAALPNRSKLVPGTYSGKTGMNHWRIEVSPFEAINGTTNTQNEWTPEKVTVTIQTPGGSAVQINTIRLHRYSR